MGMKEVLSGITRLRDLEAGYREWHRRHFEGTGNLPRRSRTRSQHEDCNERAPLQQKQ